MHEPVVLVVVNGFEGAVFGEEDNIVALRIEVEAVVVSYEPGLVGRSVEEVDAESDIGTVVAKIVEDGRHDVDLLGDAWTDAGL